MKHFQGNQIHINLATHQLKHASVAHDYVIQFKGANFQTRNWPDPRHTMSYRQYNTKWTDQTHLLVKSEDRFTHIRGQIWMAKILSQHLVSKKLVTKGYTQLNHKWQPRNKKPIRKEEPLGLLKTCGGFKPWPYPLQFSSADKTEEAQQEQNSDP